MPPADLLLTIDQGSTSTKVLVVDADGGVVSRGAAPVASDYPRPGWVEQDPRGITRSVRAAVAEALAPVEPAALVGVCLTTQRESMVVWEAASGDPVGPLINWQDGRTSDRCAALRARGLEPLVAATTGLPLDPMFSGTRAQWLLDSVDPDRARSRRGELRLGTVDSWLLHEMTGAHLTEPGNASRTQLMSLSARAWDAPLLEVFGVPERVLPRITGSAGPFATVEGFAPLPDGLPVLAVLADSHAALFAHGARTAGEVKATYGTGSSVMGLCRPDATTPAGLCLTVAWEIERPVYALEGNIRSSGSTVDWLARTVGRTPGELAELATTVPDSAGVSLVPAFNGLGAPWWDATAQGIVTGLDLGTGLPHLARAALDSIALQVEDVVSAMGSAVGDVSTLLADGGASANAQLMQIQADLGGRTVRRSGIADLSALGAAHLGGLAAGLWSEVQLADRREPGSLFHPVIDPAERDRRRAVWAAALRRARLAALP